MAIANLFRLRTLAVLAIALVLVTAAYGFAASNDVPVSSAGDGTGAVSGYTIGSIAYTLNSSDPTVLDSVRFTVTPGTGGNPPSTVKVQLATSGTWYSATNTSGTTWTATMPNGSNVSVTSITNLRVVAAQ